MDNTSDVLIIGAGVVGICTAHYLIERGCRVTVLDKGEVGSGCSRSNAGLVVPGHSMPLATPGIIAKGLKWMLSPESPFYIKPRMNRDLIRWLWRFRGACNEKKMHQAIPVLYELNRASLDLFGELSALEGMDFGLKRKGLLIVCKTQANMDAAVKEAEHKRKLNIEADILDSRGLSELEPALRGDLTGAVHFLQDAHLDPLQFVRQLARHVENRGVRILTGTEAIGFEASGGTIKSVQTTRGDFQAKDVVLASGAWSADLVRGLKIGLPIQPAKGYSITYQRPPESPRIPMILSETKIAVTPLDDMLRFGGTLELAGLDLTINRRRVHAILKAVPAYLSDIRTDRLELLEIWRGLRPCTPDGLPLIGRCPAVKNLILAAGHAMQGLSLAPATGKLTAQIALSEKPFLDIAPMSLERFH